MPVTSTRQPVWNEGAARGPICLKSRSYQQRQDIASRIYRVSHQFYFVHKINPKQS